MRRNLGPRRYNCVEGSVESKGATDPAAAQIEVVCPSGHFCEAGTGAQPCPKGRYAVLGGANATSGVETCVACPPGQTTATPGSSDEANCAFVDRACPKGYYCAGGEACMV